MADIELSDLPVAAALSGSERLPALQSGAAVAITTQQLTDRARTGMAAASHSHPASAITDFDEAVQDTVAGALMPGSNVSIVYNDTAGKIVISADSGAVIDDSTNAPNQTWSSEKVSGLLAEKVDAATLGADVGAIVGASILPGANVTVAYDEATKKTTISSTGGGGGGEGGGTGDMLAANNLSELTNKATARSNLGLGSAATSAASAFATAAQGVKANSALQSASNLSDLTDSAAARSALGLTEIAVTAPSAFATAAQGAKADTAVQPSALATVATTANNALTLAQAAASYGEFPYGTFTGNGIDSSFQLYKADGTTAVNPGVPGAVLWFEDGVRQRPGVDYSVSGNTVIRTSPPRNGAIIEWLGIGRESNVVTPVDGSVSTVKIQDNAVTAAKIAVSDVSAIRTKIGAVAASDIDTLQVEIDALKDVSQNVQSSAYSLLLTDRGKSIDTSAGVTVPGNATVAFPLGTTVSITNSSSAAITITQGSGVTLRQAGTTNTGNRTLSAYGVATLRKVDSDLWFISGAGLS